jgi:asparagine synthase (glutamine-hydrolysing)
VSAIAGIVRLDGAPADAVPLREALRHRAPVAVLCEPQGFVVVADARIDVPRHAPSRPAGDVIAEAWRQWGADCVSHLEGDFAFAVWDPATRTLFAARDAFGVKPFLYAFLPGKLFAFASVARALLVVPDVPREVDHERVREFLDLRFESAERTFHRSLRRLPGGHTLTLRDGVVAVRRWWSPRDVRPLRLRGGDAAYADGYREHFVRAVRERMADVPPAAVGALMSGGLDSSAIACVARDERLRAGAPALPVISWVFSDCREADEREFQQPVLASGGLRPLTLDSAQGVGSPWQDLELFLPDGPLYAPNYYLNAEAAKLARAQGIRVLLDGLGGDSTVSRGGARFMELFIRGRPFTLARELRALASRRGTAESMARLFAAHVAMPMAPGAVLRLASRLRGRSYGASQRFFSVRQEHLAHFESPLLAEGLELFDRLVAPFGVEGRYPFFDRRLAEYCLSLPADQKMADGFSRMVARRAMKGIVPDAVLQRAGKGAPGLHMLAALRTEHAALDTFLAQDATLVEPWTDVDALRKTYRELLSGGPVDLKATIRLWSAAVLARWLKRP